MEQRVFDLLNDHISTQYNDMTGLAAIDGHEPTYLWSMCSDHGVDLENNHLIGIEVYDSEPVGETLSVTAYTVSKNPQETYEDVAARLREQEIVDVRKQKFDMPYNELTRYIKRINIGVLNSMSDDISAINFISE